MSELEIAVMIGGMALINLAIRWPVYLFADHVRFPPLIERALAFVPVTVLTAIIVPMILMPGGGEAEIDWRNPYLVASIVAAVISWRWHKLMPTIIVGMAVFVLMRWLVDSGML